jgi:hypothetical protein
MGGAGGVVSCKIALEAYQTLLLLGGEERSFLVLAYRPKSGLDLSVSYSLMGTRSQLKKDSLPRVRAKAGTIRC